MRCQQQDYLQAIAAVRVEGVEALVAIIVAGQVQDKDTGDEEDHEQESADGTEAF